MRIAFLTDTYAPEINGIVTSVSNFTNCLAEDGHKVLIIAPKYDRKKDHPSSDNIQVRRYPSFSFASNKATHIAYPFLLGIIRDLRDFKPDVVHIQTPMSIGISGVIAARILNIKIVQTYHSYLPDFMVYLSPYKLLGLEKVSDRIASTKVMKKVLDSAVMEKVDIFTDKTFRKSSVAKAFRKNARNIWGKKEHTFSERIAWDYTRSLYGRSDAVITPSIALAKLLRRHRVKSQVIDVSNGIDFDNFVKKTDYSIKYRILNVGRLGLEGKNVDVVIRAFALAAEKEPRLILDIIGDGPAREELKKIAKELKVEEKVNFLGFVDNKVLKKEYCKSDAFITASTMETQGLVILEAMVAGLPVIGVNALAVPELVRDGQNGVLTKVGDVASLAEAILKMTQNKDINEKYGKASIEISNKHSLSYCAAKLEKVYEAVINDKPVSKI